MSGAVEPRAEGVRGKISLVEDIHREEADLWGSAQSPRLVYLAPGVESMLSVTEK